MLRKLSPLNLCLERLCSIFSMLWTLFDAISSLKKLLYVCKGFVLQTFPFSDFKISEPLYFSVSWCQYNKMYTMGNVIVFAEEKI